MNTTVQSPPTRSRAAFDASVLCGVIGLAVLSGVGAVISLAANLSPTLLDALGPQGRLSIPLPMIIVQLLLAVAAGSSRRPVAMTGSLLVALATFAGVVSGFFDGGYADERFSAFQRSFQLLLVGTLVAVCLVAVRRFSIVAGRRSAAAR